MLVRLLSRERASRDIHRIARLHLDGPILELDSSRSPQHDHPLVLVLVVPEAIGRNMALGNDSLDADVGGFEQGGDQLVGKVRGKVGEEVGHFFTEYHKSESCQPRSLIIETIRQ